ncbi:non-ribosomal peptide synthetase [Streptomyces sp. ML-6]|uniref:non-ribosomal peptide synthetase n=1 Tax=Streptomyces sp. ML-6 TaxID=2982693 RepID=UPI0024C0A878|nr:non-ribosomal peptide synthetase [Streptomyces sp. ML-6]MDK0517997.1 non-ribosomal peptide synthetase [Streptomyces sp. ML-6]
MASDSPAAAHRLDTLLTARLLEDPGRPALVDGDRTLSAGSLHTRAAAVAHALRRAGVRPGDRVAVRMERSAESVIALLAVVLSGGAHVAIDVNDPVERVAYMLEDCRPRVVLTGEAHADGLGDVRGTRVLTIEEAEREDPARSGPPLRPVGDLTDEPAVAIYTSGSTGRPKASLISHRALTRRLASLQGTHPLGPDDRMIHHTAYSFDMFLIEVYWPLLNGCTVVLAESGRRRDGEYLAELIRRHSVTTLYCVVSLLEIFLEAQPPERRFPTLRQVLTGGEPLSPELVREFHGRCAATLTNLYGPSECTIYCTAWLCPRDPDPDTVLIGQAVEETPLWILDEQGRPVPEGEPGELYIGGTGLALGYLNRPELTEERFLPDHLGGSGGRLYRSGDLVRSVPGRGLEFLGRVDEQVKVRGYRIELGEIEVTARRSPLVRHAAVVARGTGNASQLVAFVVPREDSVEDPAEFTRRLREEMGATLPAYMVPTAISLVEGLPLTKNGKLDRQELLERAGSVTPATTARSEPPVGALEATVARIWSDVLEVPAIGRTDDFFDVGGTSLKVIQVARGLRDEIGVDVPVQLIFQQPTLDGFSALLREHLGSAGAGNDFAAAPAGTNEQP